MDGLNLLPAAAGLRDLPGVTVDEATVAEVAQALRDGFEIRRAATERRIPCYTSMDTARAAIEALAFGGSDYHVAPTVEYVRGLVKVTD